MDFCLKENNTGIIEYDKTLKSYKQWQNMDQTTSTQIKMSSYLRRRIWSIVNSKTPFNNSIQN
jgi:hypothetical protein